MNIYKPVKDDGTISIDVRKLGDTEPAPLDDIMGGTDTIHHTMHFSAYTPPRPPKRPKS